MKFYTIKDIEDDFCNGVIIESEDHHYMARLAGSDGVDDPARVIPMIISDNKGKINQVVATDDNNRRMVEFKKHESGYMEAVLSKLKLPLKVFRVGTITELSTPERLTKRLWDIFADPEAEVPRHRPL